LSEAVNPRRTPCTKSSPALWQARQAGGHWFEPSTAHLESPRKPGVFVFQGSTRETGLAGFWPVLSSGREDAGVAGATYYRRRSARDPAWRARQLREAAEREARRREGDPDAFRESRRATTRRLPGATVRDRLDPSRARATDRRGSRRARADPPRRGTPRTPELPLHDGTLRAERDRPGDPRRPPQDGSGLRYTDLRSDSLAPAVTLRSSSP
jgi:hypothetical protein